MKMVSKDERIEKNLKNKLNDWEILQIYEENQNASNEFCEKLIELIDNVLYEKFPIIKLLITQSKVIEYIEKEKNSIISKIIENVYDIKYDKIRYNLINNKYDSVDEEYVISIIEIALNIDKSKIDIGKIWKNVAYESKVSIYEKILCLLIHTDVVFYNMELINILKK